MGDDVSKRGFDPDDYQLSARWGGIQRKDKGYFLCPATGEPHEWIRLDTGEVVCFRCGQYRSDIEAD